MEIKKEEKVPIKVEENKWLYVLSHAKQLKKQESVWLEEAILNINSF